MSNYTIDHCPDVELTKLPSEKVKSYDGQQLRLGTVVYFRFSPTRELDQYVVVSDRALRRPGGHDVIVVGPRGCVGVRDATDLVTDPEVWWEFWQKHYGTTRRRQSRE